MLAQGPALLMMCYINSREFERLLNVHVALQPLEIAQ